MKAMGYKQVDITDGEYVYYKELVKHHTDDKTNGEEYFRDLFDVDSDGFITMITPKGAVPWGILFFIQNVMINQRLRVIDEFRKQSK